MGGIFCYHLVLFGLRYRVLRVQMRRRANSSLLILELVRLTKLHRTSSKVRKPNVGFHFDRKTSEAGVTV